MAGANPTEALEAFIDRFKKPIACVADAYVFGSGVEVGGDHAVTATPHQRELGDKLPLRAQETGRADLFLELTHAYTIAHLPDDDERGPFKVQTAHYHYGIYDRDDREILVYHWHPEGVSDITYPHIHVPCAQPIELSIPRVDEVRQVQIGKAHLPTSRVLIEDIIEVLIQDFGVEPRTEFRDTWKKLFDDNRKAVKRGRTW